MAETNPFSSACFTVSFTGTPRTQPPNFFAPRTVFTISLFDIKGLAPSCTEMIVQRLSTFFTALYTEACLVLPPTTILYGFFILYSFKTLFLNNFSSFAATTTIISSI